MKQVKCWVKFTHDGTRCYSNGVTTTQPDEPGWVLMTGEVPEPRPSLRKLFDDWKIVAGTPVHLPLLLERIVDLLEELVDRP
jgi:hypothetical protein